MSHDLDSLTLAFHYHVLGALVRADGVVTNEEQALLDEVRPAMISMNLMSADGDLTPLFTEVKTEAIATLKDLLTHESKCDYLKAFAHAAGIDENMDDAERTTISAAAHVLEVPVEEVWALLA